MNRARRFIKRLKTSAMSMTITLLVAAKDK